MDDDARQDDRAASLEDDALFAGGPAFASLGEKYVRKQAEGPDPREQRRRKIALVAVILLALLLALAAGIVAWRVAQPPGLEPNVVVGAHPSKSPEQIRAEQQQKIAEGMIGFSVNTRVVLPAPDAKADFAFENPPGNGKRIRLTLVRDDTGDVLLETGLLDPGTYLGSEALDATLDPGTYACTAYVDGFKDDGKPVGRVAASVAVEVRDGT